MSDRRTIASRADPYDLYQRAVQQPEADVRTLSRIFRNTYGREARILREDFCGTAAVACAWVRSRRDRTARAIDLDERPLIWGALHNQLRLPPRARGRLQLVQGDVRRVVGPPADVVAAQNFSFCVFRTRSELGRYFRAAFRALGTRGILVLDVLGGADTQREHRVESRDEGEFRYLWEQKRFDPVAQRGVFSIHFRFRDGSTLRDAFTYDWRLWTIPELRELLVEAGFRRTEVHWENADHVRGGGNGVYRRVESAPADAVWVAVVVGIK